MIGQSDLDVAAEGEADAAPPMTESVSGRAILLIYSVLL